jgi:hypothetical protein
MNVNIPITDNENEILMNETVYRLCGADVACVLKDMGRDDIVKDEKFKEIVNITKNKFGIPSWSECLEIFLELIIENMKF